MEFIIKLLVVYILSVVLGFFGLLYLRNKGIIYNIDDYFKLIFAPFVNTVLGVFGIVFIVPTIYRNVKDIYHMVNHLVREAIEMYKFKKKEEEKNMENENND